MKLTYDHNQFAGPLWSVSRTTMGMHTHRQYHEPCVLPQKRHMTKEYIVSTMYSVRRTIHP